MSTATRILILGGNGFIGSHLVDAFAGAGARVRVLDRAGSLLAEPVRGVEYRYAEFADIATVGEALVDMDVVIHLISTTVPGTANLDPVSDITGNLIGTVRLLQQMRDVGVARLVFLSSGGTVYGEAATVPVPEEAGRNPLSSYGIVKVAIENYVAMFASIYGMQPLVCRVSNPYGPRQSHLGVQGVIPTFFRRILDSEQLKIWGDGSAVRDYIYIGDLVSFIEGSVRRKLSGVFNVGSGRGTSLNELVTVIAETAGVSPNIEYLPPRGFDVKHIVLDIAKARSLWNWDPQVTLRAGCELYWEWLSKQSGRVI